MRVRLPGYQMTEKQKKIMNEEIRKAFLEKQMENSKKLDCMIMLMLHRMYGFGKKRLLEFHREFVNEFNHFCEHYEMDGSDVAEIKLRDEVGIDIDKLYEEEEITGGR